MSDNSIGAIRRVLLVEDDGYCRFFLDNILSVQHVQVETARRDSKVFEIASSKDFDIIMLSFRGIIHNDLPMVRILHEDNPYSSLISVCDRTDVDFALDVLRAGAFDYLIRPFQNAARVENALKNALIKSNSLRKAADLMDTKMTDHGMVGKSKIIQEILKKCRQIAPLNVNVLINGESGTGKELIARAVHRESHRKSGPFLAVNCGAIPDGLVESIFFGHEKGAFTGAVQSHVGIMEKADGGTVFLDEIGELSPKGQVTLLRFMEDREFTKVGGVKTNTADVRIIAATNLNLENEIEKNTFREDLYYRLNVVNFSAPGLRHRPEDIMPLADFFLKRFCLKNNLRTLNISTRAASLLTEHPWPGNVRELENLMEGLAATLPMDRDIITSDDVLGYSGKIQKNQVFADPLHGDTLQELNYKDAQVAFEKRYLGSLLKKFEGNVAKAARHADLHSVTLHRKLKKLRLGNYMA
jgi:DNA-binding NtrC family response regulator